MKKNSGDNIQTIEVDPISGEYYVIIPEWMSTELSWYEGTEVSMTLEGNEIVMKEVNYER
jgi:hypothetical protein